MDSGGTLSTIIKGRQCDSPPDICASRQLSATEPPISARMKTSSSVRRHAHRTYDVAGDQELETYQDRTA
jgi:hypothetical protein